QLSQRSTALSVATAVVNSGLLSIGRTKRTCKQTRSLPDDSLSGDSLLANSIGASAPGRGAPTTARSAARTTLAGNPVRSTMRSRQVTAQPAALTTPTSGRGA